MFPAFGLEVDGVEAEAVVVDDAVDAFVGSCTGEPGAFEIDFRPAEPVYDPGFRGSRGQLLVKGRMGMGASER